MRGRQAIVLVALCVAAVASFNAFRPPGADPDRIIPLLQREGQWPHDHLMGLAPDRRRWVLAEVIASSGHSCEPRSAEFKGLREDLTDPVAYHFVRCSDERGYLVALVADAQGTTQVLDCRKAYRRGLDCALDWARMPPVPQ